MSRATATLTSCGDAVFHLEPSPELLATWTAAIPESGRSFDPRRRRWWFAAEHVVRALALAERHLDLDITLVDGPRSRATFCPCRGLVHRLHRLSGVA